MEDGYEYDSYGMKWTSDPFKRWVSGKVGYANISYKMPVVTKLTETLYLGGSEEGLILPAEVEHVVALDDEHPYAVRDGQLKSSLFFRMDDSDEQDVEEADMPAEWVREFLERGEVTLVHCRMGLNRSALVVALALLMHDQYAYANMTPSKGTIDFLREKRSPAVLCNSNFTRYLLENW